MKAIVTGILLTLDLLAASQLAIADTSDQSGTASDTTVSINSGVKFDPSSATIIDDSAFSAALSGDNGTLTVGRGNWLGCSRGRFNAILGFSALRGFGSYSATGLTGGKTVAALYDTLGNCVGYFSNLSISGFSSNPGSGWLVSLTCKGITMNGGGTGFIYSGGTASWQWSQRFGFQNGTNVSCTIAHN